MTEGERQAWLTEKLEPIVAMYGLQPYVAAQIARVIAPHIEVHAPPPEPPHA